MNHNAGGGGSGRGYRNAGLEVEWIKVHRQAGQSIEQYIEIRGEAEIWEEKKGGLPFPIRAFEWSP